MTTNQTTTNTAAVVQNDTNAAVVVTKVTGDALSANYKRIEQLVIEREVWEGGVMRISNEQLYALLAKCYSLYGEMCGDSADAKALRDALENFISMKAYVFSKDTHTLTKIVKAVFGVDRRRVSAYSLVLREALAQKLAANAIAGFIANSGGVEEVRRSASGTAMTSKQRAELGKQAIGSNVLAVVSSDKISAQIDVANVGNDLIAIVTQQADGSLVVRALINSQAALNAALACAYSESKSVTQNDMKNAKSANDDFTRNEMIKNAANG